MNDNHSRAKDSEFLIKLRNGIWFNYYTAKSLNNSLGWGGGRYWIEHLYMYLTFLSIRQTYTCRSKFCAKTLSRQKFHTMSCKIKGKCKKVKSKIVVLLSQIFHVHAIALIIQRITCINILFRNTFLKQFFKSGKHSRWKLSEFSHKPKMQYILLVKYILFI